MNKRKKDERINKLSMKCYCLRIKFGYSFILRSVSFIYYMYYSLTSKLRVIQRNCININKLSTKNKCLLFIILAKCESAYMHMHLWQQCYNEVA